MAEPDLRAVPRRNSLPGLDRVALGYAPPPLPANDSGGLPRWRAPRAVPPPALPQRRALGLDAALAMILVVIMLLLAGFRF